MENENDNVKKKGVKKKRIGGSKGRTRVRGEEQRAGREEKRECGGRGEEKKRVRRREWLEGGDRFSRQRG